MVSNSLNYVSLFYLYLHKKQFLRILTPTFHLWTIILHYYVPGTFEVAALVSY